MRIRCPLVARHFFLRGLYPRAREDGNEHDDRLTTSDVPGGRRIRDAGAGTLAGIERQAIEQALRELRGNRRLAAERLGIALRTLYDKLKRYGIE